MDLQIIVNNDVQIRVNLDYLISKENHAHEKVFWTNDGEAVGGASYLYIFSNRHADEDGAP